jgi:hypothetical protein
MKDLIEVIMPVFFGILFMLVALVAKINTYLAISVAALVTIICVVFSDQIFIALLRLNTRARVYAPRAALTPEAIAALPAHIMQENGIRLAQLNQERAKVRKITSQNEQQVKVNLHKALKESYSKEALDFVKHATVFTPTQKTRVISTKEGIPLGRLRYIALKGDKAVVAYLDQHGKPTITPVKYQTGEVLADNWNDTYNHEHSPYIAIYFDEYKQHLVPFYVQHYG